MSDPNRKRNVRMVYSIYFSRPANYTRGGHWSRDKYNGAHKFIGTFSQVNVYVALLRIQGCEVRHVFQMRRARKAEDNSHLNKELWVDERV